MAIFNKKLSDELASMQNQVEEEHLDIANNEEEARRITEKFYEYDELFILISKTTQAPFVVCDDVTYEDEVFAFTSNEMLMEYAKIFTKDKYALQSIRIAKEQIPIFLNTVFAIGADTIMLMDTGAPVRIKLEDLADGPTYKDAPDKNIPTDNPVVQLTALYFLQELRRPVEKREPDEIRRLRDLEEEMVANLVRSKFIIAFSGEPGKNGKPNLKIPFAKAKNGDILQPIFTDFQEVQKFVQKMPIQNLGLSAVSFHQLEKMLGKAAKAFAINPAGFNLVLGVEQLRKMQAAYGAEEE